MALDVSGRTQMSGDRSKAVRPKSANDKRPASRIPSASERLRPGYSSTAVDQFSGAIFDQGYSGPSFTAGNQRDTDPYSSYGSGRSPYGTGNERKDYEAGIVKARERAMYGPNYGSTDFFPFAAATAAKTIAKPYDVKRQHYKNREGTQIAASIRGLGYDLQDRDRALDVNELDGFIQAIKNGMYGRNIENLNVKKGGLTEQYGIDAEGFADDHRKNRKDKKSDIWSNNSVASAGGASFFSGGRENRQNDIRRGFREDRRGIDRDIHSSDVDYRVGMADLNSRIASNQDEQSIGDHLAAKIGIDKDALYTTYKNQMTEAGFDQDDITELWEGKASIADSEELAEVELWMNESALEDPNGVMDFDTANALVGGGGMTGLNPATRRPWQYLGDVGGLDH